MLCEGKNTTERIVAYLFIFLLMTFTVVTLASFFFLILLGPVIVFASLRMIRCFMLTVRRTIAPGIIDGGGG